MTRAGKEQSVLIKQDEEQPIAVEILAKALVEMDRAAKRVEAAGLTRTAIAILIHHSMMSSKRRPVKEIELVLEQLPRLAHIYTTQKRGRKA